MKNYLFLSFFVLSFISVGQVEETNQTVTPPPLEKQQISKENKINKRIVRPARKKELEAPAKKEESINKD